MKQSKKSAPSESKGAQATDFVSFFRGSAPYIHAHRERTFVLAFGGEALLSPLQLRNLVQDIALLHSLGIRLVLVVGARPQIDQRLARLGHKSQFLYGIRITDDLSLACVKEAAGAIRVEMEAMLSMGMPHSPMAEARLRVAAGNFVTARPVGVVEGVDFQHTGEVRRVDALALKELLARDTIALLTPVGYSPTGEAFNLPYNEVAAQTAIALGADKLIVLVEGRGLVDAEGKTFNSLTIDEARLHLQSSRLSPSLRLALKSAIHALEGQVVRVHVLPRERDGALLQELFTREGAGTLIAREPYEGMRRASLADVGGILELIEPLEREGILVRRSREKLEMDIRDFVVIERDAMIIGCASLHPWPQEKIAELACLAIHPHYRASERGSNLLDYMEARARAAGLERIFVLTTRTAHWFLERGFVEVSLRELPRDRRAFYNRQRNSKVFLKEL